MSLLTAFFWRDFRLQRSYRLQFVLQIGGSFLTLISYAFLARIVPGDQQALRPFGSDYFTFVMVGTGVSMFFVTGLNSFSDALGREQMTGTLESLLVTPNDSRWLVAGGALFPFCFAMAQLVVYFGAGIALFGARVPLQSLFLVALAMLLSLLSFSALGLLTAALLVQTKRAVLMMTIVGAGFGLLGGVMYPIAVLPGWLQAVSALLPITYAIDAVRLALIPSSDPLRIGLDLFALVAFAAVLLPAALLAFAWSVDRARREGSLGQY